MTTLRDAALIYAAAGISVFPLRPGSKEPLTAHGFKDATTSPDVIEAWWQQTPEANIGINPKPGEFVIDVDNGADKQGWGNWLAIMVEASLEAIPVTRRAITRNDGEHLWFTGDLSRIDTARLKRLHIDVKTHTGYVVAPPSEVPGTIGHYEAWGDPCSPVAELPEALYGPLGFPAAPEQRIMLAGPREATPADVGPSPIEWWNKHQGVGYLEQWLEDAGAHCVRRDAQGSHWHLPGSDNKQGATVFADGHLQIYGTASRLGLQGDKQYDPFELFAETNGGDKHVATRAIREMHPEVWPARESYVPAAKWDAATTTPEPDVYERRMVIKRLRQIDDTPPSWLIEGWLVAGGVNMLAGWGGTGKTTVAAHIAAKLTKGEPVFDGLPAHEPINVGFATVEESEGTVKARFLAAGVDEDNFAILSPSPDEYGTIAPVELPADATMIRDGIVEGGLQLLIIDGIQSTVSEDSNTVVRKALGSLVTICSETGAAVLGLAHIPKRSVNAAAPIMGSAAWVNMARTAWLLGYPKPDPSVRERHLAMSKSNFPHPQGIVLSANFEDAVGYVQSATQDPEVSSVNIVNSYNSIAAAEGLDDLQEAATMVRDVFTEYGDPNVPLSAFMVHRLELGCTEKAIRKAVKGVADPHKIGSQWFWKLRDPYLTLSDF